MTGVKAAIDELGPGLTVEMAGLDRDGMLAGFCYVNDALGVASSWSNGVRSPA